MGVKAAFDRYAQVYDETRKKLIPCFDDFYGTALDLFPSDREKELSVLDLGAGTGLMSAMVRQRFPHARILMTDISDGMLAQAGKRFPNDVRVRFETADYAEALPEAKFDVVVSALSVHHLEDPEKKRLFGRIFDRLNPGGLFINADQVLGRTRAVERMYRETWLKQVRAAGISETELAQGLERMKEDRMAPLDDQLAWMDRAGFTEVNLWYKYYNFVVWSGKKEAQ